MDDDSILQEVEISFILILEGALAALNYLPPSGGELANGVVYSSPNLGEWELSGMSSNQSDSGGSRAEQDDASISSDG